MNCTTCRYELSQCLDGRLPSGRRTEVMNHAESCATCGSFWLELQAAQELTLSLSETEVSSNFREGLWDRINAGEGTPSAVFQEEVPLWSKVRYALTGAAAAAALLIGVTFLTKDDVATPNTNNVANANTQNTDASDPKADRSDIIVPVGPIGADLASNGGASRSTHGTLQPRQRRQPNLLAAARPLSTQLVARETARQLEQRYASAAVGLRMMQSPKFNRASAISQVINNAREMHELGELLMEMSDNQGVSFQDGVSAELQYAVSMLGNVRAMRVPNEQMVDMFIKPVLSKSGRLANVSDSLHLKAETDVRTERNVLQRINTERPDVFRKLFIVLQAPTQMRTSTVFLLEDECETFWVAPKSEFNKH